MVSLYTDDRMLDHRPPPTHPEKPDRLRAILRHLDRTGLRTRCTAGTVREATRAELELVHGPAYLDRVARFGADGGGQIESDTWMSAGSNRAALLAAGAVVGAARGVVEGPDRRALCLVRPPGHHARPDEPMGFCVYGSVAAAAASLVSMGLSRVLVVDFDVHHGNGTQEAFEADGRVGFFSAHRFPFYPGTGRAGETGTGRGLGFTKNLPLPYGTAPADYHAAFEASLSDFADKVRPEVVILSAGFDAHAEDPVGDLGLDVDDFERITRFALRVADTHASGRLVSVLEGGYNVPILAGCVAAHLRTLLDADAPPAGTDPE